MVGCAGLCSRTNSIYTASTAMDKKVLLKSGEAELHENDFVLYSKSPLF